MNQTFRLMMIAYLGVTMCLIATGVSASMLRPPFLGSNSLKDMAEQSDLVFKGEVEEIVYALSEPAGPEAVSIPYTFVTYRLEKVLRGKAHGKWVTLRFIGGYDEESDLYLVSSDAPQFDIGDEDILFVQQNGEAPCPLVNGSKGRLRMIKGKVYTEEGRSVQLTRDGSLRRGPKYRLPEIESTTVHGRKLIIRKSGPSALEPSDDPGDAVGAEDLMAVVESLAQDAISGQSFVNADPEVPIAGPDMTPAPPPAD